MTYPNYIRIKYHHENGWLQEKILKKKSVDYIEVSNSWGCPKSSIDVLKPTTTWGPPIVQKKKGTAPPPRTPTLKIGAQTKYVYVHVYVYIHI